MYKISKFPSTKIFQHLIILIISTEIIEFCMITNTCTKSVQVVGRSDTLDSLKKKADVVIKISKITKFGREML